MKNTNNIQSPLDTLLAGLSTNGNISAKEQYDMFEDDNNIVEAKKTSNYDGLTEEEVWKRLGQKGLL